jgi:phenylacetate-CoA ligase
MSVFKKIYNNSPVFLQNAMVSIYGWQWNRRRFGGIFETELKKFKDRETFTKQQWDDYTNEELVKIIKHAYHNVSFYKDMWLSQGITLDTLNTITTNTIHQIPFLTKANLRKYGKTDLIDSDCKREKNFFASSGTTGTPTSILFSRKMHQLWSAAYEARVRNWAGVDRYMSRGMIGGRRVVPDADSKPPYYRYNSFEKQVYFSAYHISRNTVEDYLDGIRKYIPTYMVGYAVSNYLLARFIKEQKLEAPKLKAVITSSEKLTPEMRKVFSDVYGCKTYDGWSGVEACALVSECEHGKLHISPDVGFIEILDSKDMPVAPGETGEVVCTGFLNYEQPLIRYRIGDYMTLSANQHCDCGREMSIIDAIIGRTEDVVIGKDGREMVRFHGVFTNIPKIIMGQVVQENLDTIALNIVSDEPLSVEDKKILTKRICSQLGEVNVQIFELKEIPCGANGKYKAVISKVKRDYL